MQTVTNGFWEMAVRLSIIFNTQHDYLSPGIYEVLLVAKSNCQCSDTARVWIDVLDADAPLPDCIGTICPGATVTYTTPAGCSDFYWEVGPNGTVLGGGGVNDDNITIEWGSGPTGEIALFAQNCVGNTCPDTSVIRIPIIDDNAEIKGPEQVCPAAQEIYSIEPYQGTNFVWSLSGGGYIASGQGTNRVSVQWDLFSSNNTYELSVQYDNCYLGCGGADTIEVQIRPPFVINGPVEECENGSGLFTSKLSPGGQNLNANWTLIRPQRKCQHHHLRQFCKFQFYRRAGQLPHFCNTRRPDSNLLQSGRLGHQRTSDPSRRNRN